MKRPLSSGPTTESIPVVRILGVNVSGFTAASLLDAIAQLAATGDHVVVAYVNVHALNLGFEEPWFRAFLNQSRYVFCDGAGVLVGGRILGSRLPERITYADWMWQLAEFAAQRGLSLYLLGAQPGVAEQAAKHLHASYPELRVVGTQHGYFDKTPGSRENAAVIRAINAANPNILIVAFGMPVQEAWLRDNWGQVSANVALTGGAAFDYVSGELARGPRWMTGHGFEWLARLVIEPRRLWRRYLIGNPLFLARVIRQRLGLLHSDN
jgi:N-acetylglucosaminyldiphosphoundecaprenol N-acetyl-beta-D-mannosaminyltransferase